MAKLPGYDTKDRIRKRNNKISHYRGGIHS